MEAHLVALDLHNRQGRVSRGGRGVGRSSSTRGDQREAGSIKASARVQVRAMRSMAYRARRTMTGCDLVLALFGGICGALVCELIAALRHDLQNPERK